MSGTEEARQVDPMARIPGLDALEHRPGPVSSTVIGRRRALAELGGRLRDLRATLATSEVDSQVVDDVADRVAELTDLLGARRRTQDIFPSADDPHAGIRLFHPVIGAASPLAPPLRMQPVDGGVDATCTLDLAFEGPFRCCHGGVSALLLDHVLGYAVGLEGSGAVTRDLAIRYLGAVPLEAPLRVSARIVETEGSQLLARGAIATADAPEKALVEAEGRFLVLRPDQERRLFGNR